MSSQLCSLLSVEWLFIFEGVLQSHVPLWHLLVDPH
jgi:hypothetical protein